MPNSTCPNCKRTLREPDRCHHCGTPLSTMPQPTKTSRYGRSACREVFDAIAFDAEAERWKAEAHRARSSGESDQEAWKMALEYAIASDECSAEAVSEARKAAHYALEADDEQAQLRMRNAAGLGRVARDEIRAVLIMAAELARLNASRDMLGVIQAAQAIRRHEGRARLYAEKAAHEAHAAGF